MPFVHLGILMPFRRAEYKLSSPVAPSSLHHAYLMDTLVQRTNDFYFWQGRAGSSYIGMRREGASTHLSVHDDECTHTQDQEGKSRMTKLSPKCLKTIFPKMHIDSPIRPYLTHTHTHTHTHTKLGLWWAEVQDDERGKKPTKAFIKPGLEPV